MIVKNRFGTLTVLLLLTIPSLPFSTPQPSLEINNPDDGGISLTKEVSINGTAAGSDTWWNQTDVTDFSGICNGTRIINQTGGEISLIRDLYDDFNDNSIDRTRWSEQCAPGFNISENESRLVINGTADSGPWTSFSHLKSPSVGITDLSADINLESGTGDYEAGIELYQDNTHFARLCLKWRQLDQTLHWYVQVRNGNNGGNQAFFTFQSGPHNVRLLYDADSYSIRFFCDQAFWISLTCTLTNYSAGIYASVNSSNDSIFASFDDVYMGYCHGDYQSVPFDSKMLSPQIPCVRWNMVGGESSFYLRSSPKSNMTNPTIWYPINYSMNCEGLPLFRYIQYKVVFLITEFYEKPILVSTSIDLYIGILNVEVSLDRIVWYLADGTTIWKIQLVLSYGEQTIYCRVTDVLGDIIEKQVIVIVDSIPPSGKIIINDAANYTSNKEVHLSIPWTGKYNVTGLQIFESSNLTDVPWESYRPTFSWNLSEGDGQKIIFARLRDCFGQVSDILNASIILDTIAPTGRILIDRNAPMTLTTAVNLSLNANDLFGVAEMQISNLPGFGDVEWIPYEPTFEWNLTSGPGLKIVYARFRDNAGHESKTSQDSILLISDKNVGPVPSAGITINDGSGYTRECTIRLNTTILNGTAAWMGISNRPDYSDMAWQWFSESIMWNLEQGDGPKTIYGLFATPDGVAFTVEARVILDTITPSGTISFIGGAPIDNGLSVILRIDVSDVNGASRMMISNDPDLKNAYWEPYSMNKNWTIEDSHGTHFVYALIEDPAGWVSEQFYKGIDIDDKKPIPTGSILINNGNLYTKSCLVNLSLKMDVPSMTKRAKMLISNFDDLNGSTWENYTSLKEWQLNSRDGNKSVHVLFEVDGWLSAQIYATICLDTVAPSLPVFCILPKSTAYPKYRLDGSVEPGVNLTVGDALVRVGADGRFNLTIALSQGKNIIPMTVSDLAGNSNKTVLVVIRTEEKPRSSVSLTFIGASVIVIIAVVAIIPFLRRRL